MNLEALKQELIRDEGLRTSSYLDSLGFWTIGVGHLLGKGPGFQGLIWSLAQCYQQLDRDVAEAVELVSKRPEYSMCNTDSRQRALANMAFQLGEKLLTFTTFLSLLEQGKYKEAGEDLRSTLWAKQVPARADRIITMIENG